MTATTLALGLPYKYNAGAVNTAAGGSNINPGDEQQDWQVLIDYVNRHGGIDGRKLVPVYYGYNADTTQTSQQVEQAMCAAFTQDNHVFAVLSVADAELADCVLASGAVMVGEDFTFNDATFFAQHPDYVEPGDLSLDRIASTEVPQLVGEGYFSGHPKVGIVTYDDPQFAEATDHALVPALARAGQPSPEIERIYDPNALSGLSEEANQVSSAVLKFHTDGVDHVLFLEQSGYIPLLFLNDAESQHYYPRYGFNSQDAPELLASSGDVPADQLVGAAGIGWTPISDLAADPLDGPYSNAARRACDALMSAGGVSTAGADAELVINIYCDEVNFLRAALEQSGPRITRSSFLQGVNSLGSTFLSGFELGPTAFGPQQHDGVAAVYDYVYQTACGCMTYLGPRRYVG